MTGSFVFSSKTGISAMQIMKGVKMKKSDTLLVSADFFNGKDNGILIVGRKLPNETVKIVNAFQGDEARSLYEKLITKSK